MNTQSKSKYTLKTAALQLKDGLLDSNPILVQLLGTCPTLAVTTSVGNALGMGLAATAVLICSNLFISLLRKYIPKQIRIAAYIVIISGFVTAVEMLIKAFFPALDESLGVFIPLIVVNCIILARAEAFASKNPPLPSVVDGLSMGLGFTMALIIVGAIRELLGTGAIAGFSVFGANYPGAIMFILPPGAFITLGCVIALVQKLRSVSSRKKAYHDSGEPMSDIPEHTAEVIKEDVKPEPVEEIKATPAEEVKAEPTEDVKAIESEGEKKE